VLIGLDKCHCCVPCIPGVLVLTILLYGDEEAQKSPDASVTSLLEETRENYGSWDDRKLSDSLVLVQ